ncbi:DMT family transporter [Rhizobium laguerreae]|uniref:DMT family transporter n=1 Tax=Rhizobium laguerreae TaxID=1076926 RepID=UPI001C90A91E|nr:DMT family transporter [Rhizobium laguerreae]MBY3488949.1 DMT family transporter [Rhizobium laguerreae]
MSAETLPELSATPSSGRSNRRAAGTAILAFAVFSGADALIKLLAIDLPAPQFTLITTIVGLMLLLAYAAARGRLRDLLPRYPGLAVSRALLLGADAILIHYAFKLLPLSEAYLIAFLTPVLVAMLSFLLLGDRLSSLAWLGVVLGFVGVTVALRPGNAELNIGHVAAFVSTVFFALSLLLLRRAKAAESDEALIATLLVVMTPLSLVTALSSTGLSAMDFNHTGVAVITGILGLAGHALLVRAFRAGEASVVAPFQYSQIIWGCLYGALLFAAPVDPYTIAGALIIILSGWLVLK